MTAERSVVAPVGSSMPAAFLPPVVHEATAAVLVVDVARGAVTYANDLARELVPDRELPVPVDDWSAAAGLEDVEGLDLPEAAERPEGPAGR